MAGCIILTKGSAGVALLTSLSVLLAVHFAVRFTDALDLRFATSGLLSKPNFEILRKS